MNEIKHYAFYNKSVRLLAGATGLGFIYWKALFLIYVHQIFHQNGLYPLLFGVITLVWYVSNWRRLSVLSSFYQELNLGENYIDMFIVNRSFQGDHVKECRIYDDVNAYYHNPIRARYVRLLPVGTQNGYMRPREECQYRSDRSICNLSPGTAGVVLVAVFADASKKVLTQPRKWGYYADGERQSFNDVINLMRDTANHQRKKDKDAWDTMGKRLEEPKQQVLHNEGCDTSTPDTASTSDSSDTLTANPKPTGLDS